MKSVFHASQFLFSDLKSHNSLIQIITINLQLPTGHVRWLFGVKVIGYAFGHKNVQLKAPLPFLLLFLGPINQKIFHKRVKKFYKKMLIQKINIYLLSEKTSHRILSCSSLLSFVPPASLAMERVSARSSSSEMSCEDWALSNK